MNLCKLTENNIKLLAGKKICCVEKSVSYLEELCEKYDVLGQISCVVDTNQRNFGQFIFKEKMLNVVYISYLINLNFEETIIVITSDYYKEVFENITSVLGSDIPDITIYYFANQETEYEEYYRDRYKDHALENKIIFRSGPHASAYIKGMDFGDNARALFEHMLSNGYNGKYELIWFVKDPQNFTKYQGIKNVSFVSFDWSVSPRKEERETYYEALCLASYIFFTDAYGFARNCRSDQVRVQLWHGCGYKNRVNFSRCERRYEYTTVISDMYAELYAGAFGLRMDQMLVTGYAKQDWVLHPIANMNEVTGIPYFKKYIFWMPTFRMAKQGLKNLNEYTFDNQTGFPIVGTFEELTTLNEVLKKGDTGLIIKLHPFQDMDNISLLHLSNIILIDNEMLVEKDIQINQLLGHADALISDYSSAAVDYMLLDRPIAFTLDDLEEYEHSRGFFFDNIHDWLPGKELYRFNDFYKYVEEIINGEDSTKEKRRELWSKMHKYGDDNSCRRILEKLGICL